MGDLDIAVAGCGVAGLAGLGGWVSATAGAPSASEATARAVAARREATAAGRVRLRVFGLFMRRPSPLSDPCE